MPRTPAVYRSTHRIAFSDLDPYKHMRTARYPAYYVDHRMDALREQAGWDLKTLVGDQAVTIASFVREFVGPDAHIECTMTDAAGRAASRCLMVVAYVDKATNRAADWPVDVRQLFFET